MQATCTGETTFVVQGQSLHCDRPGCGYTGRLGTQAAGQSCPVCAHAGHAGKLAVTTYNVDIAELDGNGWCSCQDFEKRHHPAWERLSPTERKQTPCRCKHVKFVRAEAMNWLMLTEEQLDAWLAIVPDQSQ